MGQSEIVCAANQEARNQRGSPAFQRILPGFFLAAMLKQGW